MMGGVSPETCRAQIWNNKHFDTLLHLVGFFNVKLAWRIWRVIGGDVSSDSDSVFDWYMLTGKDDSNKGGSWGKIYYLVLWWCLSFCWTSWQTMDARDTLCLPRFFAHYCFASVPAASVQQMNYGHHSWLRNQKGTLNKINLGQASLFHSATWFGPARAIFR
jgi:hypothetical protein